MSNNLATTNLYLGSMETDNSASGNWSECFIKRPESIWKIKKVGQFAGLLIAIAVSPATSIPDCWEWERRKTNQTTVTWLIESAVGRPISRAEALRIARAVIDRAENERLEFAVWESKRGVVWEDE